MKENCFLTYPQPFTIANVIFKKTKMNSKRISLCPLRNRNYMNQNLQNRQLCNSLGIDENRPAFSFLYAINKQGP